MGPPSYMRSVVDRNVVMRRMTVILQDVAAVGLLANEFISRYIWNQLLMAMNYGLSGRERERDRERERGWFTRLRCRKLVFLRLCRAMHSYTNFSGHFITVSKYLLTCRPVSLRFHLQNSTFRPVKPVPIAKPNWRDNMWVYTCEFYFSFKWVYGFGSSRRT
jgi:hypothetical protein